MYLKFLRANSPEDIINDILLYEHSFDSYESFVNSSLSVEEKRAIHEKTLRYYKSQKVDDRQAWIKAKVGAKELKEEFTSLHQLLGASDETNRVLGLEIAKHTFQFNSDEIGYLMIQYYYCESISNVSENIKKWQLNGSTLYQITDAKGVIKIHLKQNTSKKIKVLSKNMGFKDDLRYVPRLLENFFINL